MSIDLHLHSTASDGSLTPEQVVELASHLNLKTISLTDHDSVEGLPSAIEASKRHAVEVIPGIEMSSDVAGRDIHVLGYYLDYNDPELKKILVKLRDNREKRISGIISKLNEMGYEIDAEDVRAEAKDGSLGRAHIAKAMLRKGFIDNIQEAFDRFIGRQGPAYVEKSALSVIDIIKIINEFGGVPVLAHPGISGVDDKIVGFKEAGLLGLEAYHSEHTPDQAMKYASLAKKLGMIITGGSDCHGLGSSRGLIIGSVYVPDNCIDELKRLKSQTHD